MTPEQMEIARLRAELKAATEDADRWRCRYTAECEAHQRTAERLEEERMTAMIATEMDP